MPLLLLHCFLTAGRHLLTVLPRFNVRLSRYFSSLVTRSWRLGGDGGGVIVIVAVPLVETFSLMRF